MFDEGCAPFARPSHRLCLVQPDAPDETGDDRPVLLIGSDHAHVDMWSVVVLARDLLAELGADDRPEKATNAPAADEGAPTRDGAASSPAPPTFAEPNAELEAAPATPEEVQARWDDILAAGGGTTPTFPLPLGPLDPVPAEVVEVRDVLDADGWAAFERGSAEQGARPVAVALSLIHI